MSTTDNTVQSDESGSDASQPLENCIPSYEKGYQDGAKDAMELIEEMNEASDALEAKQTPEPINPS